MLRQLVVAVMGADVLPSDRSLMQQLSGGMSALGQADERLACFAVCDRVPAPAELVDDALRPDRQMDVHVRQGMVGVFESDAAEAGDGPGYRDAGDRVLGRGPGEEPGERSRTRKPSVPTSKRPSGHPAIFLPMSASTADDRHAGAAGGFSASASREAGPNGPCGLLGPASPVIEPRVGGRARPASRESAQNAGEGPGTW
jgi:hypothetical protein